MDVQASVDEARARYGRASSLEADSPVAPYTSNENRALPLKITPAQSSFIQEGVRKAGTNGESAVSPQVAFERLVAGFRTGEVPTPENIARLIISLSFHKEKDKIIKCYEIGNEVLASLAVNKSWQASGWVALEDAMVTALAHCGDMKAASIHRSRMVAQGSAPTASAYGALIANIKDTTDNAAVAIELFEESRRLNVEPNAYLYNTIISRLAKARKTDYAMMLFQAMKTAGLAPTEVTYGAIIAGCARIGDAHLAEILFEEMRALPGYQARIPPFNTMMQLYTHVKPNRERALHYYELMEQMGVQPSPYTYKLLLDVYGKVEPMSIEKMEEVLETMKSRGVEVTGNHYSSIIIARGCAMQDLDGALKIFNSLQTSNVLAYEALLTVLVNHHRIDLMQQYYDRMIKKDRVRPTAYINNLLIKGWASAGDIQAARDVFEGMMDPAAGAAAPNNHAPHVGIDGNQISGSSAGSPKDPVYREPSSWEAMIRAELSAGDRERANALLHRMKSRFYPAAVTAKIEGILWAPDIPQTVERSPDF
ncbi:hypothetical protein M408DRAFT_71498 [Serendipita vermifera MAFF 305830]|uniref:Uncharacterized protein n=1 Tax=Serendipita vermifera MAFF 305830 TaxID=933852 RepID=A0A0C2WLM7_SERVB|nr:hypothetical protein M408DRAFT_71498 [Serendipita vermifera MAFF 305830]